MKCQHSYRLMVTINCGGKKLCLTESFSDRQVDAGARQAGTTTAADGQPRDHVTLAELHGATHWMWSVT